MRRGRGFYPSFRQLQVSRPAIVLAGFLLLLAMVIHARAHAPGTPHADWYNTRQLTPAAQERFGFKSCCAHADVVKARFKVSGSGNDEWWWEKDGQWDRVPADIIHWNEDTPDGQPVLFAVGGKPVCFFPGTGGT